MTKKVEYGTEIVEKSGKEINEEEDKMVRAARERKEKREGKGKGKRKVGGKEAAKIKEGRKIMECLISQRD